MIFLRKNVFHTKIENQDETQCKHFNAIGWYALVTDWLFSYLPHRVSLLQAVRAGMRPMVQSQVACSKSVKTLPSLSM